MTICYVFVASADAARIWKSASAPGYSQHSGGSQHVRDDEDSVLCAIIGTCLKCQRHIKERYNWECWEAFPDDRYLDLVLAGWLYIKPSSVFISGLTFFFFSSERDFCTILYFSKYLLLIPSGLLTSSHRILGYAVIPYFDIISFRESEVDASASELFLEDGGHSGFSPGHYFSSHILLLHYVLNSIQIQRTYESHTYM